MNKHRRIDKTPEMEELECLIMWPDGTVGYHDERAAIRKYLSLCKQIGFGRMAQLAESVEDIWRNPEAVSRYQEMKDEHFKMMDGALEALEDEE